MLTSFLDELDKIAAEKEQFSAALTAHELGHAQDYESSAAPKLRQGLRAANNLLGPVASVIAGGASKSALVGAGAGALSAVPTLADEAIATYQGMKHLKESGKLKDKELKTARNQLLLAGSSYLAQAAGSIAAGAGAGSGTTAGTILSVSAVPLSLAASLALSRAAGRSLKGTKAALSRKDVEALRKKMRVRAKVFAADKPAKGSNEDIARIGAYYMTKKKNRLLKIDPHNVARKHVKKINREGGAVIPLLGVR